MYDENIIELKFKKSDDRVAGNPYGRSVYDEQVSNKIDYNKMNVIVFPDNIKKVTSSFVQGFFSEIIKSTGYGGFDRYIEIVTGSAELSEKIKNDLLI